MISSGTTKRIHLTLHTSLLVCELSFIRTFFIIISVNRYLELFDVMNYLFSALKARCVKWPSRHLQTCSQCMSKASSLSIICSETIDFETPLFLSELTILNERLLQLVEVTRVTYGF